MSNIKREFCVLWVVGFLFLSVTSLIAVNSNSELVESVKKGAGDIVHALLAQDVDVNESQLDGTTSLHWAVHRNDLKMVKLLIEAGANVNVANDYGVTPFLLACTNGSSSMVRGLLQAGADPNATRQTGESAIMTSSRTGNLEAVKTLLAYEPDLNQQENRRGQTALMWAIEQGHPQVAKLLIERGADVNARSKRGFTPLLFAAQQNDFNSVRALLAAGAKLDGFTPEWGSALVAAAARGHEDLAIFLLEKGADPNAADDNQIAVLHYAMLQGLAHMGGVPPHMNNSVHVHRPTMVNLVLALLSKGANPNIPVGPIEFVPGLPAISPKLNMGGVTPLMLAAAAADANLARILLEAGADPLLPTEKKSTALMVASGLSFKQDRPSKKDYKSALEIAKMLVERGANVNAVGENGWTALHGAAYNGADEIAQLLLENGAQLDVLDEFQQTPWSIAEGLIGAGINNFEVKAFGPHPDTAKVLLESGADPSIPTVIQRTDVAIVE
jgi:ankyrin repeat protein